jgi:hypothetical protein
MRPSFTVTVTISLPAFEPREPEGEPLIKARRIGVGEKSSPGKERIPPEKLSFAEEVFGTVTDGDGKPVKDATVTILEIGLKATTDKNGRYRLGPLPNGKYTLRAEAKGKGSKLKPKDVKVNTPASAETSVKLDK